MPEEARPYRGGTRAPRQRRSCREGRPTREELVEQHLPLAASLARRYRSSGESQDDLQQVAALALVKAVDRYDPDRHTSLSSYAVPTIVGELKRHFRDRSWAVRPPRDLQELTMRVMRAETAVTRRLGRTPTLAELSAELGVPPEDVLEARQATTAHTAVPLEMPFDDGEEGREGSLGAEDPGYRQVEQRVLLLRLMRELPPRERVILRLRFVDDLTQAQIGERLGLSQMQVSRLIRRSLNTLQAVAEGGGGS